MSDEATHQTATTTSTHPISATTAPATSEEALPPKPPRPVSESHKNAQILKEAFPDIDITVIKAVLVASGGRVDPAFNALLSMSDPDAVVNEPAERETAPPPQPPRPTGRTPMSQVEADELYARQLAEHYDNAAYEARTQNRDGEQPHRRQATGLKPNEMYDREHSFVDDDLPVIKENLRKGFLETQTKVNSWFNQLKKRIDGEYDSEEDESQSSRHNQPGSSSRRSAEAGRRSTDYDRYDADPHVLSDDFAGVKLNPDGSKSIMANLLLTAYQPFQLHHKDVLATPTSTDHHQSRHRLDPRDARLHSRTAMMILTIPTTHHRSSLPRTTCQLRLPEPKRANGNPCPRSIPTLLPSMILLV